MRIVFTRLGGGFKGFEGIEGVGTVKRRGLRQRWVVDIDDGSSLEIRRNWGPAWRVRVTDLDGNEVGGYVQRRPLLAGGPIWLGDQWLTLVSVKKSSPLFDLVDEDGTRVARAGASGSRAEIDVDPADQLEPGLLLLFGWLASEYGMVGNGFQRILLGLSG